MTRTSQRRTLCTIAEAADEIGCHPRTIRRWIAEGRLTGYRISSRVIRVDLDHLDALLTPIIPTANTGRE